MIILLGYTNWRDDNASDAFYNVGGDANHIVQTGDDNTLE
jgi:hypothetical protein